MGLLTSVTKDGVAVEAYTYGDNGERLTETNALRGISGKSYQYDAEDHIVHAGSTRYVYDADGFLTTKIEYPNPLDPNEMAVTYYGYSSRGELIHVILPGGKKVEYEYDPMGRRVVKKVNGTVAEKYLWLGLTELLAVYDGAGNYKYRLNGPAMSKGIYNYYLVTDQVGTVRAVVYSNGNVAKRLDYDALGNVLYDSAPAFTIPITFAGGLYDPDTKLVHFAYRDYDPQTGRWTAKDPIGFLAGDTCLYGYCIENPVLYTDQFGLRNPELTAPEMTAVCNATYLLGRTGYPELANELDARLLGGQITYGEWGNISGGTYLTTHGEFFITNLVLTLVQISFSWTGSFEVLMPLLRR